MYLASSCSTARKNIAKASLWDVTACWKGNGLVVYIAMRIFSRIFLVWTTRVYIYKDKKVNRYPVFRSWEQIKRNRLYLLQVRSNLFVIATRSFSLVWHLYSSSLVGVPSCFGVRGWGNFYSMLHYYLVFWYNFIFRVHFSGYQRDHHLVVVVIVYTILVVFFLFFSTLS